MAQYKLVPLDKYSRIKSYKRIHYLGDLSLLNNKSVTIVGSRKMSSYGSRVIDYITGSLAGNSLCTVSGFVDGVDLQTLKDSIKYKIPHIICLGYGIEHFFSTHVTKLLKFLGNKKEGENIEEFLIRKGILILSQFEADQNPTLWTFPKRDALLASLSACTIVVEAAKKSGTTYTVNQALKEGKTVFVVPGQIFSPFSKGTNNLLLKASINEKIILFNSAAQLLDFLNLKSDVINSTLPLEVSALESAVLDSLNGVDLHIDAISKTLDIPASDLAKTLTKLEIKGLVKSKGGMYFRK